MGVDERRRNGLFQAVAEALGQEHAVTMFELLPPPSSDLATQEAMDLRFDVVNQRFSSVDQRFDLVDQRFDAVDQRFEAVDQRFEAVEQRFDALEGRFDALEGRFDAVDQRFADMEQRVAQMERHFETRLDDRINGLREELLAAFRGELVTAVAGQTRAVVLAVVTTTVAIGGMAVTLSQLL